MTQEEFDKAPLLDQILYDTTGMLVENHPSIAEAMDKYHQAKLKLLGIADVGKLFTAEEVVNELEDCDTLDDAIMFFKEQM
jgi:hypothetical protein